MTNDFRSHNVIYIVYDRKNENHWSLLVIRYSLLITRNGVWVIVECRVSRLGGRGRGFEVEVEVKKSRSRLKSRGRG